MFRFDKSIIFVDELKKIHDMLILVFFILVILMVLALNWLDGGSTKWNHQKESPKKTSKILDMFGNNYSL